MELPTEFVNLEGALTIGVMGIVLSVLVQATKELGFIAKIPTLLYAIGLGSLLLFFGTIIKTPPTAGAGWGEAVYLSIVNGIIVGGVAVLSHQAALRTGIIKEAPKE